MIYEVIEEPRTYRLERCLYKTRDRIFQEHNNVQKLQLNDV